jgi:hypothetical protein
VLAARKVKQFAESGDDEQSVEVGIARNEEIQQSEQRVVS